LYEITQKTRLISKRLKYLKIGQQLNMRKKNLVLKVLFNKKVILTLKKIYLDKIKNKIILFIKIKTKLYKA
jgi:hypothetical protein